MVKKIKHVTLNRPKRMVTTNDDPTIGTQENPYTLEEFNSLVLIGEWPGGWVEFIGFVPWNLADWYGSFSSSDHVSSYPDDDDDNDDDEHGADGNEEGGEHQGEYNHEGKNQGGNHDEGNHGGGNGDSGGNENGNHNV